LIELLFCFFTITSLTQSCFGLPVIPLDTNFYVMEKQTHWFHLLYLCIYGHWCQIISAV